MSKPVIAAVNGTCAGGGLHFVVDADIVIASSEATFLDPHVSVGQASAFEVIGLARRTAVEPVARLGLGGRHESLSAARAYQLGVVSQLVPPGQVREAAQELAEKIARNPPEALRLVKRLLWNALEHGLTDARREAAAAIAQASVFPGTPGGRPPLAGGGNPAQPRVLPATQAELLGES